MFLIKYCYHDRGSQFFSAQAAMALSWYKLNAQKARIGKKEDRTNRQQQKSDSTGAVRMQYDLDSPDLPNYHSPGKKMSCILIY